MIVKFGKLFSKDLTKVKDVHLRHDVIQVIEKLENTDTILAMPNIKKMKGHSNAFRLRVGKYRLGFFYDGETIELSRFVKREDIYKLFP